MIDYGARLILGFVSHTQLRVPAVSQLKQVSRNNKSAPLKCCSAVVASSKEFENKDNDYPRLAVQESLTLLTGNAYLGLAHFPGFHFPKHHFP